ncbi:MAG: hypothetical protein KF819_05525 [Labilithrix sp.]|nr:hypothetical protein [Labilithrix sp.]
MKFRRGRVIGLLLVLSASGCKQKVSQKQCDELIDRYADLVVTQRLPDAGAAELETERGHERGVARAEDAFKNCASTVQAAEHACGMKATSPEALLKCLD